MSRPDPWAILENDRPLEHVPPAGASLPERLRVAVTVVVDGVAVEVDTDLAGEFRIRLAHERNVAGALHEAEVGELALDHALHVESTVGLDRGLHGVALERVRVVRTGCLAALAYFWTHS